MPGTQIDRPLQFSVLDRLLMGEREETEVGETEEQRLRAFVLRDLNAQHEIGRARQIARLDRYDLAFGRADANADGGVTLEELSAFAAQER